MSFPGNVFITDSEARSQTVTQRLPLGTRGLTPDGRAFRYCKNSSTALAVGKLVCKMSNDTSLDNDNYFCTSTLYQDELTTATSVVYIKPAATEVIAAGVFDEGYLYVNDAAGEGQYLIIESNPALDGTVSVVWPIYFNPDSRLSATLSTASLIGMIENKYKDVVVSGPDATYTVPLGATVRAVTGSYYFWLQTWGPCVVWANLTVADGSVMTYDTFTASGTAATVGAIHVIGTSTDAITGGKLMPIGKVVAHALAIAATTTHALVNLEIEP